MGIRRIDRELCNCCGICIDNCPMDVIRMEENFQIPVIKYLRDCQSCFMCSHDCPQNAIYVSPERERRIPLPW